jgi:putative effector of murein hydrolase LrgA (UPF0299 family)
LEKQGKTEKIVKILAVNIFSGCVMVSFGGLISSKVTRGGKKESKKKKKKKINK